MNFRIKELFYLALTLVTFVAGYFFLRYAYKVSDTTPFTQEIVLIILGTIATVFITSLLLNKQTSVEIEKEQSIKYLELKTKIYEGLLDLMEELATKEKLNKEDITKLQFVTHKLAIVASPDVLVEYNNFLQSVSILSQDGSFQNDSKGMSDALCSLTVTIRSDLLHEHHTRKHYSLNDIQQMIVQNSNDSVKVEAGSKT